MRTPTAALDPRTKYQNQARMALSWSLILAVLTLVNTLLVVMKMDFYMLVSAFAPYILGFLGMYLTGNCPPDYYEGLQFEPLPAPFLVWMVAGALVIAVLYLACAWLARKRPVFLFAVTALYLIDTAVLLWYSIGDVGYYVRDYFIHIIILIILIRGALAFVRLRALPAEADATVEAEFFTDAEEEAYEAESSLSDAEEDSDATPEVQALPEVGSEE